MNKPDTPLHEKSYPEDWIAWVGWRMKQEQWADTKTATKILMKETRGLINPKWITGWFCPVCGGTGTFNCVEFIEPCRNCCGQGIFDSYMNEEENLDED